MPLTELETQVQQYVAYQMQDYRPWTLPRHGKILHDAIWGTLSISAAEMDLIDCPLLQRLRFIGQIGLAFFTFPSGRHSRFEHSIGVMAMATKMATALNETSAPGEEHVTKRQLQELRLAALLHDVGHGFFSHISETMYGPDPRIQTAKDQAEAPLADAHEILGYLIVRCAAFRSFFSDLQDRHESADAHFTEVQLDNVAELILGRYAEQPEEHIYLGDILNGPFDADKLDYIARDAYFTGLTMSVDIERLLNTLRVRWTNDEPDGQRQRLVTTLGGATALEQVVLSKLRLYHVLYHHPKVRAADRRMGNIARYMRRREGVLSTSREGSTDEDGQAVIRLHSPVDYLKHTDGDFLGLAGHRDPDLRRMIESVRRRELPVKALVISPSTVTARHMCMKIISKVAYPPKEEGDQLGRALEEEIYAEIPEQEKAGYIAADIIVDIPKLPELEEAALMKVISYDEQGREKLEILNDVTHMHDWCGTSMVNKWRGHVFSPRALQIATNRAAISVFQRRGFTFHPLATKLANIHE